MLVRAMRWLEDPSMAGVVGDMSVALLALGHEVAGEPRHGDALVQRMAAELRLENPLGTVQLNSLGFASVADLAAVVGCTQSAVALVGRIASCNEQPLFEILEHRLILWIRAAGGVPLAVVRVEDLRMDERWVQYE